MRDYLTEMLYALTSAYSHKDYDNRRLGLPIETNIGKLFSVLAWGLDSVQEQAELIKLWDNLDYACGSVLDRYGANFGVKRFGAGDRFYRLAIKVKLLAQLSGGDINTVLDAAAALLDIPVERLGLKELFPAKIGLDIQEADLTPETLEIIVEIVEMIKRILAAGVGLIATLYSYRTFENTVTIYTALFNHSCTVFDLPDVQRTFTQILPVQTTLFDQSRLVFTLPEVSRTFEQTNLTAPAAFTKSGLTFGLPDTRRELSKAVPFRAVMFERSGISTGIPPSKPRAFKAGTAVPFALFERSEIRTVIPPAEPREFRTKSGAAFSVFEYSGFRVETIPMEPQMFKAASSVSYAVFEYSRLMIKPIK